VDCESKTVKFGLVLVDFKAVYPIKSISVLVMCLRVSSFELEALLSKCWLHRRRMDRSAFKEETEIEEPNSRVTWLQGRKWTAQGCHHCHRNCFTIPGLSFSIL